ncbi:hypothetical protein C8Q74DRAFT_1242309 [Fomes fomentarius]|nr:hypothetical protein C8Q74DRAFT_1242309 [Fomes fomentarius]
MSQITLSFPAEPKAYIDAIFSQLESGDNSPLPAEAAAKIVLTADAATVHEFVAHEGVTTALETEIMYPCLRRTFNMATYVSRLTVPLPHPCTYKVVCKYAVGDNLVNRLRVEEHVYRTKLKHLQRECVPLCVGLFTGHVSNGTEVGVLVLEYIDYQLPCLLYELPRDLREKILNAYLAIHAAGVEQCDFNDDQTNIMIQELPGPTESDEPVYRPIIIDFDHAEPHVCVVNRKSLRFGMQAPSKIDHPCQEIWQVCADADMYKTPATLHGVEIPRKIATDENAVETYYLNVTNQCTVQQYFVKQVVDAVKKKDRNRKELDERRIGDLISEKEKREGEADSEEASDSEGDDKGHSMSTESEEEENKFVQARMKDWGINSQEK